MPQFTSSAKILTSYVQTPAVDTLVESFGNRLQGLSKYEKYRLCAGISLELIDLLNPEVEDRGEKVGDRSYATFGPDAVGQSRKIIDNEKPEVLAQLLPAIAEYARDDDRV